MRTVQRHNHCSDNHYGFTVTPLVSLTRVRVMAASSPSVPRTWDSAELDGQVSAAVAASSYLHCEMWVCMTSSVL